jgi:hypothetical protein
MAQNLHPWQTRILTISNAPGTEEARWIATSSLDVLNPIILLSGLDGGYEAD